MNPRLQKRVQRYGWDRAVGDYEAGWRCQLEPAQARMLELARLRSGEQVLDVACGTGLVSFRALEAVGEAGAVLGTDISGEMVAAARAQAQVDGRHNVRFERADAECQDIESDGFDAALCALGLMYVPDPDRAMGEMYRALKPGGRAAAAVWGARANCGWADIFPITDARVESDVCPMFFALGTGDTLANCFEAAGFADVQSERISVALSYSSEDEALGAAFRGGPVALAYSRFDTPTRAAVHRDYLDSIAPFRHGEGYRIPGEFVVARGDKRH